MSKKHKEAVQKQFTKTAEAFSTFAQRDTPEILQEKVEFSKPQPGDVLLDVACGPGAFVLAIAPRVKFARGIDLTGEMLVRARAFQTERNISNAAFDRGEAEQLPYADASFDLVACQCAFHHMPKAELAFKEMIRVTKPEGRIALIDTLGPESDSKFDLHNEIEIVRDPSHAVSLRLTTYLSMFDANGLEVLRQSLKRRQRSFNQWMIRAGHKLGDKRYIETRKMIEEAMTGDKAGFASQVQGDDILITHNEGLFLLTRKLDEKKV